MTDSEGVIQYQLDHRAGELPTDADYPDLFLWFTRCREHELIGQDPARYQGYAFGNISVRCASGFVVSGTQTGGKPSLAMSDLAWVTEFDSAANRLSSIGPSCPSSEAMTHGEIYRQLPSVNAVIHVHSPTIWHAAGALGLPTTSPQAGYGTPEMAREVAALLARQPLEGLLAMAGHVDGIVAYGGDMQAAGNRLLQTLAEAERYSTAASSTGTDPANTAGPHRCRHCGQPRRGPEEDGPERPSDVESEERGKKAP